MSYVAPTRPRAGGDGGEAGRRAQADLLRALRPPRAALVLLALSLPLFAALCALAWRSWS